MFFHKTVAKTEKTIKDLYPEQLAKAVGTSVDRIFDHRNELAEQCKTLKWDSNSFSVSNIPSEIKIVKKIIFKNEIFPDELTTTRIAKKTGIPVHKILEFLDEIEKNCPTYRTVYITGRKTFVIKPKDLKIIIQIYRNAPKPIVNKRPPQLSARELVLAAKAKREQTIN